MNRITLFAGTPEHEAFASMLVFAEEGCAHDDGFLQTIRTHQRKFHAGGDYELLILDFQYIMELASLEVLRQHPETHGGRVQ